LFEARCDGTALALATATLCLFLPANGSSSAAALLQRQHQQDHHQKEEQEEQEEQRPPARPKSYEQLMRRAESAPKSRG
jgi:Na+/glutamate symporter